MIDGKPDAHFMFEQGFKLPEGERLQGVVRSRGLYVLVTDWNIYVARADYDGGFTIQRIGTV